MLNFYWCSEGLCLALTTCNTIPKFRCIFSRFNESSLLFSVEYVQRLNDFVSVTSLEVSDVKAIFFLSMMNNLTGLLLFSFWKISINPNLTGMWLLLNSTGMCVLSVTQFCAAFLLHKCVICVTQDGDAGAIRSPLVS